MPYFIEKVTNNPERYKVYSIRNSVKKFYSNKGLPLKTAMKQLIALRINTNH